MSPLFDGRVKEATSSREGDKELGGWCAKAMMRESRMDVSPGDDFLLRRGKTGQICRHPGAHRAICC
jgi:hypothetical protein